MLTQEQAAIIESEASHKVVVAGAGTGKTFVLVEQIVRWIDDGVDPGTMMAVTYTRRAGEELRSRVLERTGETIGYVGTIHSWCLAKLWKAGIPVTPLESLELAMVVDMIAERSSMTSVNAKRVCKLLDGDLRRPSTEESSLATLVMQYMHEQHLVLVGALPRLWLTMARMRPVALTRARASACCIMWDEYQDSDPREEAILDVLQPDLSFVVGDHRQAIYQFRGGDSSLLARREGERFPLTINRRSCAEVVNLANRVAIHGAELSAWHDEPGLIERDEDLFDGCLWPLLDEDETVHVLCRTNREVRRVGYECADRGVSCHVVSRDLDPYAAPEWIDAYSMARYVMAPECEWTRDRVMKMQDVDVGWLNDSIYGNDTMHRMMMAHPVLRNKDDARVRAMQVSEFIRWYGKRDLQDQLPDEADAPAVVAMTVHASKGLEFDRVVLADVGRKLGGKKGEEERNVLYVGITRAKSVLALNEVENAE